MPKILVLHGPNLNMLGTREPERYGKMTLSELDQSLAILAADLAIEVVCRQSNHEGALIDWIQAAQLEGFEGILMNPAGLTHTSVSLRDAVLGTELPLVEVHLTNIHAREEFRHRSFVSGVAQGVIVGLGANSYLLGLRALADLLEAK